MTNRKSSAKINTAVGTAGVAQLVEQLICNQQAGGSSPSTSSTSSSFYLGEFQSGQMGQTVNLLSLTSVVRIHLPPPAQKFPPPFRFRLRRKLHSGGNFFAFHRDSLRWTRGGRGTGKPEGAEKSILTTYSKENPAVINRSAAAGFPLPALKALKKEGCMA